MFEEVTVHAVMPGGVKVRIAGYAVPAERLLLLKLTVVLPVA